MEGRVDHRQPDTDSNSEWGNEPLQPPAGSRTSARSEEHMGSGEVGGMRSSATLGAGGAEQVKANAAKTNTAPLCARVSLKLAPRAMANFATALHGAAPNTCNSLKSGCPQRGNSYSQLLNDHRRMSHFQPCSTTRERGGRRLRLSCLYYSG